MRICQFVVAAKTNSSLQSSHLASIVSPNDEVTMSLHALLGTDFPENRPLALLDLIEAGLPAKSLAAFKSATGMSDEDIARVLNIGGRTLTRVRNASGERLPSDLSDRLFAVASVYRLAEDVFGNTQTAIGWLNAEQFGLGQRIPRDLLASEFGRHQVRSLLQRIEFGQLA
jgi:putative toxin-antitoxin system antitoxin component (TIGR02293 family)